MKRSVEGRDEIEARSMADCLMLLSRESMMCTPTHDSSSSSSSSSRRVFECKTCNRQFQSFQALGGHRASHKRPRLGGERLSPAKPKKHECSVCGSEFAVGQALGGHMRRHRGHVPVVVMKKSSSSSRRVLCLDLNLTPVENDLEFRLAYKPRHPMIDWPGL